MRTWMPLIGLSLAMSVATLSAKSASARLLLDGDMASLWHQATLVVEAEELYAWKDLSVVGKVRVTRVHKGDAKMGEEIPVAIYTQSRAGVKTNRVLLFLTWRETSNGVVPAKTYLPVGSGVKLITDEAIYRFEQMSNPGPYVAVRQYAERIERSKDYRLKELREDLEQAKQRAERFQRAVNDKDVEELETFLPVSPTAAYLKPLASDGEMFLVRARNSDALCYAAASALVRHVDGKRIAAILKRHGHRMTFSARRTLERAAD